MTIRFPYLRDGQVINIKYRAVVEKAFWMVKGAERILYGLDDILRAETVCIVEGEIDKLSIDTAGGPPTVSVPDGAPAPDAKHYASKFSFLDGTAMARLRTAQTVLIGTDMEPPAAHSRTNWRGASGTPSARASPGRQGYKDANEVLVRHGPAAVLDALANAQPYPALRSAVALGRRGWISTLLGCEHEPRRCACGRCPMPERDAVTCNLGDGYLLIAAGLRREKSGDLTADLMLKNGRILYADRGGAQHRRGTPGLGAGGTDAGRTDRRADGGGAAGARAARCAGDPAGGPEEAHPGRSTRRHGQRAASGDFATDVAEAVELFHDPGGIAYATIPIGDHRETWPLHSKGFRQWLARRYHEQHGKTPNAQALVDATNVLAGKAIFDGPEHPVHLRLAEHEGVIYLDLCNERWEAIAIDRAGWRVVANPPVKFRRTRGMLPAADPGCRAAASTHLRRFINVPLR